MSMLRSLKGLQHDLATGFKSLATGGASDKRNPEAASEDGQMRQLGAGAELLNRFQTQWAKLHQEAEENACAAEDIDQQVTSVYLRLEQENNAMTQLVSELASIPQLLHDIQQSMDMIGEIEVHCSELDTAFEDLRDVYRECELHSKKQHHQYQLTLYQQRRELELEQIKVQFARKQAHSVESYEAKLRAILQEKQQVCEELSKQEMEHYRLHGHTQLKPSTSPDCHVDLADISLDQDQEALDTFLQNDDGNNMSSAGPTTDVDTEDDSTQQDTGGPTRDSGQSNNADMGHCDTTDTGHSNTVDKGHSDTIDMGQSDTGDTGHSDTVDMGHSDTVDMGQSNSVDTGQSETGDTGHSDIVKGSDAPTTEPPFEDQHHK